MKKTGGQSAQKRPPEPLTFEHHLCGCHTSVMDITSLFEQKINLSVQN